MDINGGYVPRVVGSIVFERINACYCSLHLSAYYLSSMPYTAKLYFGMANFNGVQLSVEVRSVAKRL